MNPILKDLGYGENDRVVIFHADDVGMCQSTLTAYTDLLDFGLLSSAAVMVPCPWFSSLAAICRERDDTDIGVHLTITSEWDSYRWSPLSTSQKNSGLLDEEGYFYRDAASVQAKANSETVERELTFQVERAINAGIDITHIDSHMGALFHEKFLPSYFKVGLQHQVPMLLSSSNETEMKTFGLNDKGIQTAKKIVENMSEQNIATFDQIFLMDLDEVWDDGVAQTIDLLEKIPAGLTYFIIHPASDTPELREIAPDWRARVRDYEAFKSPILRDYVQSAGFDVIGYQPLRGRMRE